MENKGKKTSAPLLSGVGGNTVVCSGDVGVTWLTRPALSATCCAMIFNDDIASVPCRAEKSNPFIKGPPALMGPFIITSGLVELLCIELTTGVELTKLLPSNGWTCRL